MRHYVLLTLLALSLAYVQGKPLISFGIGLQKSLPYYPAEPYYNNYYGAQAGYYSAGAYHSSPYGYSPYAGGYAAPGVRYGLNFGIGAPPLLL